MTKAKDLRSHSDEELSAMYHDIKKQVFQLKSQAILRKDTVKPHELRQKRKEVARILTVQHERRL